MFATLEITSCKKSSHRNYFFLLEARIFLGNHRQPNLAFWPIYDWKPGSLILNEIHLELCYVFVSVQPNHRWYSVIDHQKQCDQLTQKQSKREIAISAGLGRFWPIKPIKTVGRSYAENDRFAILWVGSISRYRQSSFYLVPILPFKWTKIVRLWALCCLITS